MPPTGNCISVATINNVQAMLQSKGYIISLQNKDGTLKYQPESSNEIFAKNRGLVVPVINQSNLKRKPTLADNEKMNAKKIKCIPPSSNTKSCPWDSNVNYHAVFRSGVDNLTNFSSRVSSAEEFKVIQDVSGITPTKNNNGVSPQSTNRSSSDHYKFDNDAAGVNQGSTTYANRDTPRTLLGNSDVGIRESKAGITPMKGFVIEDADCAGERGQDRSSLLSAAKKLSLPEMMAGNVTHNKLMLQHIFIP